MHKFCLCIILLLQYCEGRLQCKNVHNEVVDWFVVYKFPLDRTSSNDFIRKGVGFAYITSNDVSREWNLGNQSINSSNNLIAYTLQPLYEEKYNADFLWMLYNDETPNKTVSDNLGHTKGVILTNNEEGFWLVHSVPRFPPIPPSKYSYPKSGLTYGQSFLCVSVLPSEMDKIGNQLKYNEPQVYSTFVPPKLKNVFPNLVEVIDKSWIKSPPWNNLLQFSGSGGMLFYSFAKTKKFEKDLYSDWIAPVLKDDLVVETWPNGRGRLPSACQNLFKVYNIQSMAFPNLNLTFSTHVDHSKWSIAINSTVPWICIGDINRMQSQEKRSGGTVCMRQRNVWSAYKMSINQIEPCAH